MGIRIQVKIKKQYGFKVEPWRAMDANNGGLEAENGALYGSAVLDSHHIDKELDADPQPC